MIEPTYEELNSIDMDAKAIANQSQIGTLFAWRKAYLAALARAVLAKWGTPPAVAKWAPEEIADGERGIRWVTNDGIHGRPTDHDVREYLKRTPTAHRCHCDECKQFYTAQQPTQAQAGAITPPPIECNTEELKRAYAFGWWSALAKQRETTQAGAVPLTEEQRSDIATAAAGFNWTDDYVEAIDYVIDGVESLHSIKGDQHDTE